MGAARSGLVACSGRTLAPRRTRDQRSDDGELAPDALEYLQARVELLARVLGGHDGPHPALLLRHRREADPHGEDALLEEPVTEPMRQRARADDDGRDRR